MNKWNDSGEGILSFVKVSCSMLHMESCTPAINYTWGIGDWSSGEEAQVRRPVADKQFCTAKIDEAVQSKYGRSWSHWSKDCTCSRRMKGNIWYSKFLFHMLEVAVLNAHIMYQGAGHQGVSHGDFKELLVEQLIGGNSFCRDTLSWNITEHVPDVHLNQEHLIIIV